MRWNGIAQEEVEMNNKRLGNLFEHAFCQTLHDHGWWVYNCPMNAYGQPVDVIAVKDTSVIFADCKACTKQGFSFFRIEENQENSMNMFQAMTGYEPMFVFKLNDGSVYGIAWSVISQLKSEGVRFLGNDEIREIGIPEEQIWQT